MKRRVLITMLAMSLTAAMMTGCGKPNQSQAAETAQESTVETSEESNEVETSEENISDTEAEPETQVGESTEEITSSTEDKEEAPQEATKPATQTAAETSSVAPADSTPAAPQAAAEAEQSQGLGYNVTAMTATMYVKNTVNLRQGPGTSYSKVGSLNKGDQVTVTGLADNGWYQLDNGAFVSDKYLDSNAPAAAVATAPGMTVVPTEQTGTVLPVISTESYGGASTEFINYLNQQRSAAGLGTLAWDDGIAALAQQRAKAIVSDFSHNGAPAGYGEILQDNTGSSYVDWFNSWNTSTTGHKENMFRADYGSAGCGYYFNAANNRYYVVVLFKQRERTQEELAEIMNPDNMVQIGDNAYIDQNSYNALVNAGIDPSAQPNEDELKRQEEQEKLLNEGVIDRVFLD